MTISDPGVKSLVEEWVQDPSMPFDQRFVYYLLGAKGVCVVPISAFASDLLGFRVTLLEEDEEERAQIFRKIKEGIMEYCISI